MLEGYNGNYILKLLFPLKVTISVSEWGCKYLLRNVGEFLSFYLNIEGVLVIFSNFFNVSTDTKKISLTIMKRIHINKYTERHKFVGPFTLEIWDKITFLKDQLSLNNNTHQKPQRWWTIAWQQYSFSFKKKSYNHNLVAAAGKPNSCFLQRRICYRTNKYELREKSSRRVQSIVLKGNFHYTTTSDAVISL